jgi:hypothetical protein
MKNLLFILFGLLLYDGVLAQTTLTFPPGKIASEEYVEKRIKAKFDSLAKAQSGVVINIPPVIIPTNPSIPTIPTTPVVTLPNCDRGPTITKVTYDASIGISVVFDGLNVKGMDYLLLGPVYETITKGSVTPTSNTIRLGYPNLPDGAYHLTLIANTCTGRDSEDFIVRKK